MFNFLLCRNKTSFQKCYNWWELMTIYTMFETFQERGDLFFIYYLFLYRIQCQINCMTSILSFQASENKIFFETVSDILKLERTVYFICSLSFNYFGNFMISLKYDQLQTLKAAHLFLCLKYFKNVLHKLFSPTHHLI